MKRSDRGYVDIAKRTKNLQKLKKRKEDTGVVRRFPHKLDKKLARVITDADKIKSEITNIIRKNVIPETVPLKSRRQRELREYRQQYLIRERAKRKAIRDAERKHDKIEAERLKRELEVLEEVSRKTIRAVTLGEKTAGTRKYGNLKQIILNLERQKKILQSHTTTDLDAVKKAIKYVERQKEYISNVLTSKVPTEKIKEVAKIKTIKELLGKTPPTPPPLPPPPPPPGPTREEPDVIQFREKRLHTIRLRIRAIKREIVQLEGEIAAKKKSSSIVIGRDRGVVGERRRKKDDRLQQLNRVRSKLQRELQTIIRENQQREVKQRARQAISTRTRTSRSTRRGKPVTVTESPFSYSDIYLMRRNVLAKYTERDRKLEKVIMLIMVSQDEYNNIVKDNWLKMVSGYTNFGVGIASTDNISFEQEDACDTYVDITKLTTGYSKTEDIPQETREKIESLCKDRLHSKIEIQFYYVPISGVPFEREPKIICVMPIHERRAVTIETVNRLKKQKFLDDIVLIGDSAIEERIAATTGVTYAEYHNTPLSWKVQVGVDIARKSNPDAIMISGSDNWLSDDWCQLCAPHLKNYDVIGAGRWWMARVEKRLPLEILSCRYLQRGDPIGGGRMISSRALDRIDWGLYTFKRDSGLDGLSWDALNKGNRKMSVKILPELINLGIKGDWEQRDPYIKIKNSHLVPSSTVRDPEKWLDTNFPGWEQSFAKFS